MFFDWIIRLCKEAIVFDANGSLKKVHSTFMCIYKSIQYFLFKFNISLVVCIIRHKLGPEPLVRRGRIFCMTAEAGYKEPYFQKSLKKETHLIRAIFGLFLNILMSP